MLFNWHKCIYKLFIAYSLFMILFVSVGSKSWKMELIWNHSDNSLNPSIVAQETDCRSDINEPSITTRLPVHIVNRPIGCLLITTFTKLSLVPFVWLYSHLAWHSGNHGWRRLRPPGCASCPPNQKNVIFSEEGNPD